MGSRRQEKVARVVKEAVSEAIRERLNDPRIVGLVSITRVEMSPDLRNADIFLSIMATDDAGSRKTFKAIKHANHHIRRFVGSALTSKFCPQLHFHQDEKFKKTLEMMRLIDEAAREYHDKDQEFEDE